MNKEERNEYVLYRIESARDSFAAAELLLSEGFITSAINRLYYAAFYSVNALLVANKVEAKSHKGPRAEFLKHFVKENKVERDQGKLFSKLYDLRQTGDYDYLPDLDIEAIKKLSIEVRAFIDQICVLANSSLD